MVSPKFKQAYKSLNKEQREAVETIEGPLMVVAGPGTGKTEVLTLRIANILLKTDCRPENILALTFTDAAAFNMRRRLSSLIGSSAYRVVIQTFHSFCNGVIQDYPESFANIIGSSNITEVETVSILENIIKTLPLKVLRPWGDPNYYLKEIANKISELKREGLTPIEFGLVVEKEQKTFDKESNHYHKDGIHEGKMKGESTKYAKRIAKNKELQLMYDKYQQLLRKKHLYDWDDMIIEVLEALRKNKEIKLFLQEEYQYVLVDEHQDTNNAQNKILELLMDYHKDPNIFVVGDEKQAIFRFQGASVENFLYFKRLYPKAKLIELSINYRSDQALLDAAHSIIPSKKPLKSAGNENISKVNILTARFTRTALEAQFVAEKIKDLTSNSKIQLQEIAVIYRSNRDAFPIAEALEKNKIKYSIESDEDLFSDKYVQKFIKLLYAIENFGDDQFLVRALHINELEIDPLELYKMVRETGERKISLFDLMKERRIPAFEHFKKWVSSSKNDHLSQFLEKIIRESGILESMVRSRDASAFLGIERLFEEAKRISLNTRGATLTDFIKYLDILKEHKLYIKRPKSISTDNVHLLTAHRSKGQEFGHVFIVNSSENSFGPKRDRDVLPLLPSVYREMDFRNDGSESESEEDERRIFYVALTRAKKNVFITYHSLNEDGKELLPSPFINEIRLDRIRKTDTQEFEEKLKKHKEILFAERKATNIKKLDQSFVSELFRRYPLSVTALNNYLDCPWKYFYRNLLRIPEAMQKHQIYGSAMHGAINDLWGVLKERQVKENFLIDSFKRHLGLIGVLSSKEKDEILERGVKSLRGWFRWVEPKITNPIITEFAIKGVALYEDILIGGKLDKVEFINTKTAIVTDYKTGKQKSRNFIEGNTKDSNGDMKRQLVFYKILLELHDSIDMKKGVIEFLEPSETGRYSREEFEINNKEVEELKQLILKSVKEITTLSFWNKKCEDKECEYCSLRNLLDK